MEDYYEYLDSNGVTTLYKLIKDDTVALIDSYSVTINGITTTLDSHVNNTDIHTTIATIEGMIDTAVGSLNYATPNYVDTKIAGLVNSAPETLDTLQELSDALGNDTNFATTVANQIGNKANKDSVYTKEETDTLLEGKANSIHNHVTSDITDFPTIPTKTSQLINDSGFLTSSSGVITSVSWSDITNKPNFSTVATSGSYTDLSNTPAIPTKVSQLENDTGFVSALTDVVDTKSNQTINGTKTFTSGPRVTNNHIDTGYSIKNTALARNDIPTEYQHYTFRAYDKNNKIMGEYCIEKATTGDALLNMNVRSEDSSGTQIAHGLQFRMTNDGSLVRFMPSANNKVHLGDVGAKWASVHATNAHITHTYTNRVNTYSITHPTDDSYFFMSGGTDYNKGATLYLGSISATNFTPGRFALAARKTDGSSVELAGSPNGSLTWGGKNVALDENLVHTSGTETIAGTKKFTNDLARKCTAVDITTTPASDMYVHFNFTDKNDKTVAYIQYAQKANGVDYIGLRVRDKNSNTWGVQLNTNKEFVPLGNNSYSLGSSSYKWKSVYATTFNGNLSGTIASSTTATTQATSDNSTRIATTAWVRNYVNSVRSYAVNSVACPSAMGSSAVDSSIAAYYSNATTLTAEGSSSSSGSSYPSDYSDYIDISPTVGTIYTGSQLFSTLNASASGSKNTSYSDSGVTTYQTTAIATATFSGAFSPSAKYLCTTANAVRFRAFVSQGTTSDIGTASVSDNSSARSIFTRIE